MSFHIEPGHRVMFRSVDPDLGTVDSCWMFHPSGAENCDDEPPNAFDATFDTPGGNKWWVEVYVDANQSVARVQAQVEDGTWRELTKRSWGAWAASFPVPDGSLVRFRAFSSTGAVDVSGQYRWPDGTPFNAPIPPAPLDLAFAPKAGNEWWVETLIVPNNGIVGVEARVVGGNWKLLSLRSWGAWAGSFHVPTGSTVEFRATWFDGRADTSDGFRWPNAVPTADPDGAWPQEGSYARYRFAWGVATDTHASGTHTFAYHGGQWWSECIGNNMQGGMFFNLFWGVPPPSGPTRTTTGAQVQAEGLDECRLAAYDLTVQGARSQTTHQEGDAVTTRTWYGSRATDYDTRTVDWDTATGLSVRSWDGGTDWAGGLLDDTDAPLATV